MSYHVAIVGATGLVGRELLKILAERQFPVASLRLFASTKSAGQKLPFDGRTIEVEALQPEQLARSQVVFLTAGAKVSRELAAELRAGDAVVCDNSSAFRLEPDVPLCVPEINPEVIGQARYLAVGNCTAILLCLALAPLERQFGLRRVIVSTYQAVSGAGARAVQTLYDETAAILRGETIKPTFGFNLVPAIAGESDLPGVTGEEAKVVAETRRILRRPDLPLDVTCVRVPVERAHSEAVWLELNQYATLGDVRSALSSSPGVSLRDDLRRSLYPQPSSASGGDGIFVGRIRANGSGGSFSLFLAGDQLRKGAALNAVQLAELRLGLPTPGRRDGQSQP